MLSTTVGCWYAVLNDRYVECYRLMLQLPSLSTFAV